MSVLGVGWEHRDAARYGQTRSGTVIVAASVPLTCANVLEQGPRRSDRSVVVLGVGSFGRPGRSGPGRSAMDTPPAFTWPVPAPEDHPRTGRAAVRPAIPSASR